MSSETIKFVSLDQVGEDQVGERFVAANGEIRVHLPKDERDMLGIILEQFRTLLFSGTDPDLACLEHPGCLDDAEAELEYQAMAANRLLHNRLEAIEKLETGLYATTLSLDDVSAWMQSINSLRLFMAERLGLSNNLSNNSTDMNSTDMVISHNHPYADLAPVYQWLGLLLGELVDVTSECLPGE